MELNYELTLSQVVDNKEHIIVVNFTYASELEEFLELLYSNETDVNAHVYITKQ